jgi:VPDSG-CTERM motif
MIILKQLAINLFLDKNSGINMAQPAFSFRRNLFNMKSIIVITLLVALTGVANATQVSTNNVPDAGSASVLMGLALAGIAAVKRFIR